MTHATIIVPTIRRPDSLHRALMSLLDTCPPEQCDQIIVVDNDPLASAKSVVEALSLASPIALRWLHEPRPGVSNARNAGVAAAVDAPFIAFLDDDETAQPDWLTALLAVQAQTGADVVFGPIAGDAPSAPTQLRPMIEDFFSRHGPSQSGPIQHTYGCGNSLMRKDTALCGTPPFCASANETGGEDDLLFARLTQRGCTFAWADDARVIEHVPPQRATLSYVAKRAFAYGQGPSQQAAQRRDWAAVLGWMSVGAGQSIAWSVIAAALGLLRHPAHPLAVRRAYEGTGKVFWFSRFEPKFYGTSQLT